MTDLATLLPDAESYAAETRGTIAGVDISSLTMDTRRVEPGALFFCITGATSDGHDFAADAASAGAKAIVVTHFLDDIDVPQIKVDDVRAAMGIFADRFYGQPTKRLDVFGITGTNGKTTSTFLLRAMLEAADRKCGVVGTTGIRIGGEDRDTTYTTPEVIDLHGIMADMREAGDDSCAIEVSSHAIDQGRVGNMRYASIGFTNLTRDHLDYHKSFEQYFQTKRRLFVEPGPEGQFWPAAINCDDEWGSRLFDELVHAERDDVPVWGYTLLDMARASVSASYALNESGASIKVESPVGDFTLSSKLRGRFNVENVLGAATMALLAGLTPEQIQQGLDDVEGVPGRFQPVDAGQDFTVIVDYAHTPDSLEQVLASARDMTQGELIVVFGCGGDRDRSKRPLMGRIAAQHADTAIVTSDNPRSEDPAAIVKEIRKGLRRGRGAEAIEILDRREAIEHAISLASTGDVVVIAGKGHEQGQVFADEVKPFDDATVVRESLAATSVS